MHQRKVIEDLKIFFPALVVLSRWIAEALFAGRVAVITCLLVSFFGGLTLKISELR
jgi:hypothetical protein